LSCIIQRRWGGSSRFFYSQQPKFCYVLANCLKWSNLHIFLLTAAQILLYIIQRRLVVLLLCISKLPGVDRLALFVCYISSNCLEWIVPKIYYISSNADRLDVLFLLICISKLPGVERLALFLLTTALILLYIIQRRLIVLLLCISKLPGVERLALFVCYISSNCLEWIVPKIY
jgi:hypothetical protein